MEIKTLTSPPYTEYDELFANAQYAFIQQSTIWGRILEEAIPDKPYYLIVQDNGKTIAGLPLYLFENPLGNILTSVPHAGPMGGVLLSDDVNIGKKAVLQEIYSIIIREALSLAKKLNVISMTIITNPFYDDVELYQKDFPVNYSFENFTQIIDLNKSLDNDNNYVIEKKSHRQDLRRNLKKINPDISVEWLQDISDFDEWYDLHIKRTGEQDAVKLPNELLASIIKNGRKYKKADLVIAKLKTTGKIIGGVICIFNEEILDFFILSCDSDFFEDRVNFAIIDFVLKESKQRGIRWCNWQSCSRNSGTYSFKERWGSEELLYYFLTWTFPGFEKIFDTDFNEIVSNYQWHYVAPFAAIEKKLPSGDFKK